MPVAVVTKTEQRFELKSLPGAFVMIRRRDGGQWLNNREEVSKMKMNMSSKKSKDSDDDDVATEFQSFKKSLIYRDFRELVIDHNLEDEEGVRLNLTNSKNVDRLAAPVIEEVVDLIEDAQKVDDKNLSE